MAIRLAKIRGTTERDKLDEKEGLVGYHLHRLSAGYRPGRPIVRTHASDLMKADGEFCPRERALIDLTGGSPPAQFIGTATSLVFAQGELLAQHVIDVLSDANMVVGDWQCMGCGEMYRFCKKPSRCKSNRCACTKFSYHECRFLSDETGVSCGVDMLLDLPTEKKLKIVEIKTMDKDKFKSLKMPLSEHKWRTNLYMRLASEHNSGSSEVIDVESAIILYVSKGGYGEKSGKPKSWGLADQGFTPFKEFVVTRDDDKTEEKMLLAKSLRDWRLRKAPIPRGICDSNVCKRAQACPSVSICFSNEYPVGAEIYVDYQESK